MLFVGDDRIVMRRIVALDGKKVWTREKINPIRAFDDRSGIEEKRRGGEDSFDLTTGPGFPIVVISREWNKRGWGGGAVNRGERETVWTEIAGRIERASERTTVESWKGFSGGSKCSSTDRGGEFSVEIIDVSRVIDELEPGTRNIHTRGNACARTSGLGRW